MAAVSLEPAMAVGSTSLAMTLSATLTGICSFSMSDSRESAGFTGWRSSRVVPSKVSTKKREPLWVRRNDRASPGSAASRSAGFLAGGMISPINTRKDTTSEKS